MLGATVLSMGCNNIDCAAEKMTDGEFPVYIVPASYYDMETFRENSCALVELFKDHYFWHEHFDQLGFYRLEIENTSCPLPGACDVAAINEQVNEVYAEEGTIMVMMEHAFSYGKAYDNVALFSREDVMDRNTIAIHEFTHAFSDLGDETYDEESPYSPDVETSLNCASDKPGDTCDEKWAGLEYECIVGCMNNSALYRPAESCLMNGTNNSWEYCPVCTYQLEQILTDE